MKIIEVIGIILLILLVCYFVWGLYLSTVSRAHCKVECENRGTEFFEVIKNRKMNVNDMCVCWFENKLESFVIE